MINLSFSKILPHCTQSNLQKTISAKKQIKLFIISIKLFIVKNIIYTNPRMTILPVSFVVKIDAFLSDDFDVKLIVPSRAHNRTRALAHPLWTDTRLYCGGLLESPTWRPFRVP